MRSLLAYLNPIAAFVAFLNLPPDWDRKSLKIAKAILLFLVILGFGQLIGLPEAVNGILQFFVPRASGTALVDIGGRGVTLLSSEPSRAGTEFVFLYLIYRLTHRPEAGLGLRDFAALGFLVVVVRAAQPVTFGAFAIGLLFVRRPSHAAVLVFAMLLGLLLSDDFGDSRVVSLIERAFEQGNFSDALFFVANESGHRLTTIYAFFLFGIVHPLGGGIGMWPSTSIQAITDAGIDFTQLRYFKLYGEGGLVGVRGSGLLSNAMLDIGLIGTGFFLYWIFKLTRRFRGGDGTSARVMMVLLVKIAFVGSVGEPLPWVATALILHHMASRRHIERA